MTHLEPVGEKMSTSADITALLERWQAGDEGARDAAVTALYKELRMIARQLHRQERQDHTLDPTAVVNELWLKLEEASLAPHAQNRHYLRAWLARAMRQLLVDYARRHGAEKRGGGATHVTLSSDAAEATGGHPLVDAVDLDRALAALTEVDELAAQVVELKFFLGMTIIEVSECLKIGRATAQRHWTMARAFLLRYFERGEGS